MSSLYKLPLAFNNNSQQGVPSLSLTIPPKTDAFEMCSSTKATFRVLFQDLLTLVGNVQPYATHTTSVCTQI
jgi:hypothetical protein